MSHNCGNRAPGRLRTEYKKNRVKRILERKKLTAITRKNRVSATWKANKDYQKKQEARLQTLQKKEGYGKNILFGQTQKTEHQRHKEEQRKIKKQLAKTTTLKTNGSTVTPFDIANRKRTKT